MTEHTPMGDFETRLSGLVRSYTEPAATPSDPHVTARMAMTSTTRDGLLERLGPVGFDRRMAWLTLAAALLVALIALAVAVGTNQPRDVLGRIVFVRGGDLFIAETDGSGQTRIAEGGADAGTLGYLTAIWAPHGRHIAAVRDTGGEFLTPAVDLLTAAGAVVRTVELGRGGTPSMTWSPDGSEVAIAAYAADLPRDVSESIFDSGIRLLVAGLDARADREIELPPDWRGVASSEPGGWTVPEFLAKWSSDGRRIAIRATLAINPEYTLAWRLVALDGSGTRSVDDLISPLGFGVDNLDWSPDGRRLAISGGWIGCETVCLGIVDPDGGSATSTVAHPSAGGPDLHGKLFHPEFSAAGDRVAILGFLMDSRSDPAVTETVTLYNYDLATARFTELTSGTMSGILDATGAAQGTGTVTGERVEGATAAWTPDGQRLLYLVREADGSAATWTLRSIDSDGGSQSTLLVQGVQSFDLGSID